MSKTVWLVYRRYVRSPDVPRVFVGVYADRIAIERFFEAGNRRIEKTANGRLVWESAGDWESYEAFEQTVFQWPAE